jgi:hypothetical protein
MNRKYLYAISWFIFSMAFASCDIFKSEIVSFEGSNKQEYQFHNGNNEFTLHFMRWTDNGHLNGFIMETNGRFKFKKKNEIIYDETVFLVDLKALDLRINDVKIPLSKIYLQKDKNSIFIETPFNYGKGSEEYQNLILSIIPSDFVTNKGKRVISDTISVRIYKDVN